MKIKELLQQLGTTNTTLARWITEFDSFFSTGAKQRQREFTEEDFGVLAAIAKLSRDGMNYDAIRSRLAAGYRESLSTVNFGVDTRLVPAAAMEQIIDSAELKVELENIRQDRDRLVAYVERLEKQLDDKDKKMEQIRDTYSAQIVELHKQITELSERAGKAEGELNYRRELDKRKGGEGD